MISLLLVLAALVAAFIIGKKLGRAKADKETLTNVGKAKTVAEKLRNMDAAAIRDKLRKQSK